MAHIHEILKKYWGYDAFREKQEEIINSVLNGHDTLGLLPTGGGKSLCFQVPALANPGICIVVSPLIALMKDQVQNLVKRGINAKSIVSGMSTREIDITLDNCVYGDQKFLYVSPERLKSPLFIARVQKMNVNLIAVDEAHCISQWGYDFRPEYLQIAELRTILPNVPVMALTATATPDVVVDIQDKLHFKQKIVFQKSFERSNLTYYCINADDKWAQTQSIINRYKGLTGIVYVRSRKRTKEYANYLRAQGVSADFYHGGLDSQTRTQRQEDWINNKTRVIVATNAFGMGIDKPDVRFVVHIDLPDTLEAYFQEAGRGGRDLKPSIAILIHNKADQEKLNSYLQQQFPAKEEIRVIYRSLGNYYKLAIGAGKEVSYPFDLSQFCNTYKHKPTTVMAALKLLELQGYLTLTDTDGLTSRFMFLVKYNQLYEFYLVQPAFKALIMLLVRTYGGIYDSYAKIDEQALAKTLQISTANVKQLLQQLQKLNLADYIEATKTPQLTFTVPRQNEQAIRFDKAVYEDRFNKAKQKLDAIFRYVSDEKCRSSLLLKYFGEENNKWCGQCDVCKRTKANGVDLNLSARIIEELAKNTQPKSIEELANICELQTHQLLYTLRWMADNGLIKFNEENKLSI